MHLPSFPALTGYQSRKNGAPGLTRSATPRLHVGKGDPGHTAGILASVLPQLTNQPQEAIPVFSERCGDVLPTNPHQFLPAGCILRQER
ncbi:MAG: hypothetical protein Kow0089_10260 [Desulfobulbaceae bacterium]